MELAGECCVREDRGPGEASAEVTLQLGSE